MPKPSRTPTHKPDQAIALAVDFDGTLQLSDLNWEGIIWLLRAKPWACLMLLVTLMRQGKVAFKLELQRHAEEAHWLPALPWDPRMVELMAEAKQQGREVIVATGSSQSMVVRILRQAKLDYEVMGTEANGINLTRTNKAEALTARFGKKGFDYAGNSLDDLLVWSHGRQALVVNALPWVEQAVRASGQPHQIFSRKIHPLTALLKALRPHQWLKNLLVFVPLVAAHSWGSMLAWVYSLSAFLTFCLAASGVYLLNDLLDLQDDRAHPTKRRRPFAAGTLPVGEGLVLSPLFLLAALGLAYVITPWLGVVVLGYVVLSWSYAWWLKHSLLVDVLVLSALYWVRMMGGAAATNIPLSGWLSAFAVLVFFSLALLKRYIELRKLLTRGGSSVRAYQIGHTAGVAGLGVLSGLGAVGVMAAYILSPAIAMLYSESTWLLLLCPVMLMGLLRMWWLAHKGQLHDDPVVFAARDVVTWLLGVISLIIIVCTAA